MAGPARGGVWWIWLVWLVVGEKAGAVRGSLSFVSSRD